MSIFDFTEEDLRDNRSGLLSPRQKEFLQMSARNLRRDERRGIVIVAGGVVFALCVFTALILQDACSGSALVSKLGLLGVILAPLCIFVSVFALAIFLNFRSMKKLKDSPLLSVSGAVRQEKRENYEYNNLPLYYVFVGAKYFIFINDMSQIFREGIQYKVYYCKSGTHERILSYEQLSR